LPYSRRVCAYPMGRPKETPSKKVDLNVVEFLATRGFTDEEIGKVYGRNECTINRWKKDPKFVQALKKGKDMSDTRVERALYERATGYNHKDTKFFCHEGEIISEEYDRHYPPDTVACIFWLKNRKKAEWRDRIEHTGADGGAIKYDRTQIVHVIHQLAGLKKALNTGDVCLT